MRNKSIIVDTADIQRQASANHLSEELSLDRPDIPTPLTQAEISATVAQAKDDKVTRTVSQLSNGVKIVTTTKKYGPFKIVKNDRVFTPGSPELKEYLASFGATPEMIANMETTNFFDEFKDADGNIVFRDSSAGTVNGLTLFGSDSGDISAKNIFSLLGLIFIILICAAAFILQFS